MSQVECSICDLGNSHMINTWVIGSSVISCNGIGSKDDNSLLRLFPQLTAYRGSRVVILFSSEQCDHFWFDITEFHKGEVTRWNLELSEEEIEKENLKVFREMWRD
jgi:hypothetical protein